MLPLNQKTKKAPHWRESGLVDGEAIAVLDIGSSRMACALAELDGIGRPRLLAAEMVPSYGIRGGSVVDLARASESMGIVLDAVCEKASAEINSVIVGFSGESKLTISRGQLPLGRCPREVQLSDVTRLHKMIRPEAGANRRIIHRFDGPYSVGDLHGIERPMGLVGPILKAASTFLTVPEERVVNLLKAVRGCGVDIEHLILEPLATSFGALSENERTLGVAVLDFGAGGFRGALWEGGRIRQVHVSSTGDHVPPPGISPPPDGMNGIVRAMARRFRIAPHTAQKLMARRGILPVGVEHNQEKLIDASAVDGVGNVRIDPIEWSRALERFLIPIVRDLRDGLTNFSSSHAGGVILSGQGAQLDGLDELVARHFDGTPTRMGLPQMERMEDYARIQGEGKDGEPATQATLPSELQGPGGCALWGLLTYGAILRTRERSASSQTFLGRLRRTFQRAAASL